MSKKKKSDVISIDEIKKKSKGEVVAIPDWNGRDEINVRLRMIDVTTHLLSSGTMPNELRSAVDEAFAEGASEEEVREKVIETQKETFNRQDNMEKMVPVMNAVAKEALVEPTFDEIEEVYPLTLQQKLAIFEYVTRGMSDMKSFREEQSAGDAGTDSDG